MYYAALAELGFVVVTLNGRGTAFRGRAIAEESYGWMPSSNNTEDRIAGIKQLAKRYPYMDLTRVGIIGLSGSVGPVYGLLQYPEFYKVGVCHAMQDTRLMPPHYGEHHEGINHMQGERHYAEELVDALQGKLLIMHALCDPMANVAMTWRLVYALQKANKNFDMLILPHPNPLLAGDPPHMGSLYALRRTWDYFVSHLQGIEPPCEFDLSAEVNNESVE